MVIERQDVWYMDDAGLTYTLCEDNSPLAEPPVRSKSIFFFYEQTARLLLNGRLVKEARN